jgi:hypothetical protein
LASELYAVSQGKICSGPEECYWCSGPCGRANVHDDLTPVFHTSNRNRTLAKRPGNAYVCEGCWMWRRKRVTAFFLSEGFKDGQCPMDHSWWVTDEAAWAVRVPQDARSLYTELLEPPLVFCLALIDGPGARNHVQQAVANELTEIKADTPLAFTLNGIPHEYTVYELDRALRANDPAGKRPGVGALMRILGPCQLPTEEEKKAVGRPKKEFETQNPHKKMITKPGA